jgi:hypothetical protein
VLGKLDTFLLKTLNQDALYLLECSKENSTSLWIHTLVKRSALVFQYTQKQTLITSSFHFPKKEKRVTVDTFERKIIKRVESGWDGQPIHGTNLQRLRKINKINPNVVEK